MAVYPLIIFFISIGVGGFTYWLFDNILDTMLNISGSGVAIPSGSGYAFLTWAWKLAIPIILAGVVFWLLMKLQKPEYARV